MGLLENSVTRYSLLILFLFSVLPDSRISLCILQQGCVYRDIFWAVVAGVAATGSWIFPVLWTSSLEPWEQSEWSSTFPTLSHSFSASVRWHGKVIILFWSTSLPFKNMCQNTLQMYERLHYETIISQGKTTKNWEELRIELRSPISLESQNRSFVPYWKRPWCWEGLGAGGEGDDREWDGWMASPTPWAWVWVIFGSWWWTGRPGVLRFMGSQRVGHDWATELNWTEGTA